MRRDEYLKQKRKQESGRIPKDILNEVVNQWNAAGFDHNALLDENGNWYIPESDWIEAERSNRAFVDMQMFWRKKLNWGINADKQRWYNRSEAAGILFEQYLFYCVKQDKQIAHNVVKFPDDSKRTLKNAQVFDGWKESTKNEKRKDFIHALAAIIMDMVLFYRKETALQEQPFNEWFANECQREHVFKRKQKPHPYMVFGDEPGKSKHYKLTKIGDDNGVAIYECLQPFNKKDMRRKDAKGFYDKYADIINTILSIISITALLLCFFCL